MRKSSFRSELEIEKRLIQVLGEGHNQWHYRPDLKTEDDLWANLHQKISQNNVAELNDTPITNKEFEMIKTELLAKTRTPFEAARWLKGENGIARITIEREDISLGVMSLVLYSNHDIGGGISSYEVVHQIAKRKEEEDNLNRRFDVTLLINGLPIVQMELKKVTAEDGIYEAFNQIQKYASEGLFRNNIFATLQIFVVSNEATTRYFANALPNNMHRKFLFSWRTPDNKKVDNIYEFAKDMLKIPDAHRLIADYTIVSEEQDSKVLMVLHPYQIHAIQALYKATKKHQSGYIWHATGSGKTLTSFVSTKLLAKKSGVDRTIMLIDRKDLDNQTTSEFTKFASEFNTGISSGDGKANTLIVGTGSSRELTKTLLSDTNSNTIIVTTRQKLDAALRYAEEMSGENGKNRFEKLKGQHIVFVVDECHRAISAEGMQQIKEYFPKSTWFGFTGTPIFKENKKQAKGQLARTTDDQYGDVLHTYTIKNALEDGSVLGFQVEHEDTLEPVSVDNIIYNQLKTQDRYINYSADQMNDYIDKMDQIKKETYLPASIYDSDEHVEKVVYKILNPNNIYTKFDFENGKPRKSAILTTSSIAMAKKYYYAIKKIQANENWLNATYSDKPLRTGQVIDDPDFPRIAITYSMQENEENAYEIQEEMKEIIADYNAYYETSWSIQEIERYNGDINNRLARKKGEFKQFGNHLDLVIVVDRLLTGFDAPAIQTLFVDRNLSYANLIQAFSRTNRTYPDKEKGMIVTYRYPATMEKNVEDATILYSREQEKSALIYPNYKKSKDRFLKAYQNFSRFEVVESAPDEHSPMETRVDYVKAYQELNNAYEALATYNEYSEEFTEGKNDLQKKVSALQENEGVYQTVKGSIQKEESNPEIDLTGIKFYGDYGVKKYDIDSAYINKLLDSYAPNNKDIRDEIEKALTKLNKSEAVKEVYRVILNDIDNGIIDSTENTNEVKERYFTRVYDGYIHQFANEWCVSEDELQTSAIQYDSGDEEIPNIKGISDSRRFDEYKENHPEAVPFHYFPKMRRAWGTLLDSTIIDLNDELK